MAADAAQLPKIAEEVLDATLAKLSPEVFEAIRDVRNDATETNWLLARHRNNEPLEIELAGSGSGGVSEMAANLDDTTFMYGFLRITELIDGVSKTVKFLYIYFTGEEVPYNKRGRLGVVHGGVRQHFQPYHTDLELTRKEDLNDEVVQRKLLENRGKIDNVKDGSLAQDPNVQVRGYTAIGYIKVGSSKGPDTKHGFRGAGEEALQPLNLTFADNVTEAILDVRNDKSKTNWMLVRYEDDDASKPIVLMAKGSGGLTELHSHLNEDTVAYGFLRMTDVRDGHQHAKYGLILFIGSGVSILKRGRFTPHKGGVIEKFSPYHVHLEVTTLAEISETNVMNKIQMASGTRNWVLN